MQYEQPLIAGILIRRYKRFLSEVRLMDGTVVLAHCPNSGAMTTCCEPGRPVFLSRSMNPGRKCPYTWELYEAEGGLVCVNTQVPNRVVYDSVVAGKILELRGYQEVAREVGFEDARFDICLKAAERPACFVEVKNCTLLHKDLIMFPDAVTRRGVKHLEVLMRARALGCRAVMFYFVARPEGKGFAIAGHIDSVYAATLLKAVRVGVEVLAYRAISTPTSVEIGEPVPLVL
ncbi:MAG: DNA/RNA nuclease SfsA [Dissulfuribacterales bacterium]